MIRTLRLRPRVFCRNVSIFEKYNKQLRQKAEKEGISLSDLIAKAQGNIEKVKLEDRFDPLNLTEKAKKGPVKAPETTPSEALDGKTAQAIRDNMSTDSKATKELSSFIDVEKLRLHPRDEIEMIWKARFLNKTDEFAGSMNAHAFSRLYMNARKFPSFVVPLPHHEEGVELHYVEWSFAGSYSIYCLATSLAEYKLHTDFASPSTTLMVHSNFVVEKDVALLNGAVQTNKISLDNSVLLALSIQRFYAADPKSPHGAEKLELLRQFNQGDATFSVDKLIEAAETLD